MELTTNKGKNQKISREVREESVEAIYSESFFLKTFSIIQLRSSLCQWEISKSGRCDNSRGTNNKKISKNFLNFFLKTCRIDVIKHTIIR